MSLLSFERQALYIQQAYPTLSYEERLGKPVIYGELSVFQMDGITSDNYQIEIHFQEEFPYRFPYLYEVGGKIPRNADWHVFESTGNCCIKASPEELLICKDGITIMDSIKTQVIPYLYNQTFRRENGYFLKERSHGVQGWTEYFKEILETDSIMNVIYSLNLILSRKEPNRVSKCFCGKNIKYRYCHKTAFKTLARFSNDEIQYFINELKATREYRLSALNLKRLLTFKTP